MKTAMLLTMMMMMMMTTRMFTQVIEGATTKSNDDLDLPKRHRQGTAARLPPALPPTPEVTIVTTPQHLVVPLHSRVSLECEFVMDSFRVFDNPMVWEKQQATQERDPINMMGVIMEPFASARRYEVVLDENPPLYVVKLKIKDLSPEDSGNYTCELRGKKSKVLGRITHVLSVISPIRQLQLIPDTGFHITDSQMTLNSMTFNESQPASVVCITKGGYPLPTVSLLLNGRNITDKFRSKRFLEVVGNKSMMSLTYRTSSCYDDFFVTSAEDGSLLTCSAYVVDPSDVIVASVTVVVNYKPDILCEGPVEAATGDRDVRLVCYVRARPEPYSLRWTLDFNSSRSDKSDSGGIFGGGSFSGGSAREVDGSANDRSDELYPLVRNLDNNKWETNLFIRKVLQESFRHYRLICENLIGATEASVELRQRSKTRSKSSSSSSSSLKSSSEGISPSNLNAKKPWHRFHTSSSSSPSNHPHHHHHHHHHRQHHPQCSENRFLTISSVLYDAVVYFIAFNFFLEF